MTARDIARRARLMLAQALRALNSLLAAWAAKG